MNWQVFPGLHPYSLGADPGQNFITADTRSTVDDLCHVQGGFAGSLNGRRSQTDLMPKILVAAMDVVKDVGQSQW